MIDFIVNALEIYIVGRFAWECVKLLAIIVIGLVVYIGSGGKKIVVKLTDRRYP